MKDNVKGFSLVEMAIVLVIFGLIMSAASSILVLFVNKGGAEKTRRMVESDKNAIYSYVSSSRELPTKTLFLSSVTYPTDGYGKQVHYYADPILDKSIGWWNAGSDVYNNVVNTVCGSYYTNTEVWVCKNATCADSDTDRTAVKNIAYAVISGSENKNIQTGVNTVVKSGANVIRVYPQGSDAKDDYTTDMNRAEKYDDVVDWVTLNELRTGSGCDPEQYKYLSQTMPAASTDSGYVFNFYIEGGIPIASDNTANAQAEYNWSVEEITGDPKITSNGSFGFKVVNSAGSESSLTTDGVTVGQGAFLRLSGNSSSYDSQQYRFRVTVTDKAYAAKPSAEYKFTKTFILNAQY
ncbi:MAG: type II secretion system protein [Deferribacterales bacterium]